MQIRVIAACTLQGVIGTNGTIPWKNANDFSYLLTNVMNQVLIVGRKSYMEFGTPLLNTHTIVVSGNEKHAKWIRKSGALVESSLPRAIELATFKFKNRNIWIGGGERLFHEGLELAQEVYLNRLNIHVHGDAFFPLDKMRQFGTLKRVQVVLGSRYVHASIF